MFLIKYVLISIHIPSETTIHVLSDTHYTLFIKIFVRPKLLTQDLFYTSLFTIF